MAGKVKALQLWCKQQCEGYRDVEITNMTSSWKSGLAFCAMIHRYRPDLIDYDSLSKENVYENNKLAFDVALRELDIPALLDAEDMVAMRVPDKLCIVTYVSQYYNCFRNKQPAGGPGEKRPLKRQQTMLPPSPTPEAKRMTTDNMHKQLQSTSPATKAENTSTSTAPQKKQGTLGDTCAICKEKVYILERHFCEGKLYHRRCFRERQKSAQRDVFAALRANQEENTATGQNLNTTFSMDTSESHPPKTSTPYTGTQARERRHGAGASPTRVQMRDHGASSGSPFRQSHGASTAVTPSTENMTGTTMEQPILFTPVEKSQSEVQSEQRLLSGLLKTLAGVRKSATPAQDGKTEISVSSTGVKTGPDMHEQTPTSPKSILKTTTVTTPKSILKNSNHAPKQPEITDTDVSSRHKDISSRTGNVASNRMDTRSGMENKHMSHSPKSGRSAFALSDSSDPTKKSNEISTKPIKEEQKPAWQVEAEKRMRARGGKYIDPENKKEIAQDNQPSAQNTALTNTKMDIENVSQSPRANKKTVLSGITKNTRSAVIVSKDTDTQKDSKLELSRSKQKEGRVETCVKQPEHVDGSKGDTSLDKPMWQIEAEKRQKARGGKYVDPEKKMKETRNDDSFFEGLKISVIPSVEEDASTAADIQQVEIKVNGHGSPKPAELKQTKTSPKTEKWSPVETKLQHKGKKDDQNTESNGRPKVAKTIIVSSKTDSDEDEEWPPKKRKQPEKNKNVKTQETKEDKQRKSSDDSLDIVEIVKKQLGMTKPKRENNRITETRKSDEWTVDSPKSKIQPVSTVKETTMNSIEILKRKDNQGLTTPAKSPRETKVTSVEILGQKDNQGLTTPTKSPRETKVTSVEILRQKDNEGLTTPAKSPKGQQNGISENDSKASWQKEAERRQIARNGQYPDPEHSKKVIRPPTVLLESPTSPPSRQLRKIVPDTTFRFSSFDDNSEDLGSPIMTDEGQFTEMPVDVDFPPEPPPPRKPQRWMQSDPAKSTKNRRAPPPPPSEPVKRRIGAETRLSQETIKQQLEDIDVKLQQLERQGRVLEEKIRSESDDAMDTDDDNNMLQWFELVNQKNELVRKEAELMYKSKQQELEDQHSNLEYEVRVLMAKTDKTEEEKQREEYLLQQLVETVIQRNNIVDSIEEDRIRYIEEDKEIAEMMAIGFPRKSSTASNKGNESKDTKDIEKEDKKDKKDIEKKNKKEEEKKQKEDKKKKKKAEKEKKKEDHGKKKDKKKKT